MKTLTLLLSMFYCNAIPSIPKSFIFNKTPIIQRENININQFLNDIQEHKYQEIIISDKLKNIYTILNDNNIQKTQFNPLLIDKIINKALENNINIKFYKDYSLMDTISNIIFILPFIFLGYNLVQLLLERVNDNNNLPFNNDFFSENTISDLHFQPYNITDWAGSQEVKEECLDIIQFIQNKDKFNELNVKIPKGILLEGPPGTGKTLLAKIMAQEANANFISISGSEFVELYVGVGASRVRKLFQEAKKKKPSIIFIDEIDAIGRKRSNNAFIGNEEREQTLNQLLSEMDGFKETSDIIVMAATNRIDILDKALLRPGRFDRIIRIPLPDFKSRIEIFKLYLSKKKVDPFINYDLLATLSEGFSGAKISNIINEASILAIKDNKDFITNKNIMDAIEKSLIGIPKKYDERSYQLKKRVAIHEIGHAFISYHLSQIFDLEKVTIQSTYNGAGGYTIYKDNTDEAKFGLYTKDILIKKLLVILGGRIAEDLYYGKNNSSVGASQDLKVANNLAKQMIISFGFSSNLESFQYNPEEEEIGDQTKSLIDQEVLKILNDAYLEGFKILKNNKSVLDQLVELLIEKQTLYKIDFDNLMFKK
jgi:cell division protease FtsH